MTEELKQAAQQALEALDVLVAKIRRDAPELSGKSTGFAANSANALRRALTQRPAAQAGEREAWVPYLVDRADGVKGHYAIGRWNPRGYREVWNLHSHRWAAYSDDVMSLEEADSLLRQITIPTARASLPTQPAAQTDSMGMPTSCGKPLCSPDEHHPLCRLHKPAAQATPAPVGGVRCEGCGYMTHHREHMGCVRAAKQHTHPAPGVPEGMVLVPLEPTPEMLKVQTWDFNRFYSPKEIWAAMLAAAQAKGGEHD